MIPVELYDSLLAIMDQKIKQLVQSLFEERFKDALRESKERSGKFEGRNARKLPKIRLTHYGHVSDV